MQHSQLGSVNGDFPEESPRVDVAALSAEDREELERFRRAHETQVLTIFFSDLVGSTRLQTKLGNLQAANLVRKQVFPVHYLPIASLAGAVFLQAAAVAVVALGLAFFGEGSVRLVPLAGAFLLEFLVVLGPILALSSVGALFRDLPHFLGTAMTAVFYLTPVLYHESLVPERFSALLAVNPFRDVIALFRAGIIGTPVPPVPRLVAVAAVSALVAWAGARLFAASRKTFADVL